MARTGRRPGATDTRTEILDAARAAFAAHGYDRATIRMIGGDAGVDPSLVHHYFGSKEGLFAAAMRLPIGPDALTSTLLEDGLEGAGERLARLFLTVWEQPEARQTLLGILRSAFTSEGRGAQAMREFITAAMVGRIAPALDGPDPQLRVQLAAGHLVGVAVLRYVLRFEPLASAPVDRLVPLVGSRIQGYLTG